MLMINKKHWDKHIDGKKIAKNMKGSITIETVIVVPFLFLCVLFIIYISIRLYRIAAIQVSTDIADRVSIDTGTSSDICTDIDSGDFTTADNDIIYNSNCRKSEMFIRKERTVILFNYSHRNKVTGVYEYYKIKF